MLQNWPIRSKLAVILVIPLVALAVLSAIQVRGNVDNVRAANRIKALAAFSIKGGDLVAALQAERYATNAYVGSNYLAAGPGQATVAARGPVDQASAAFGAGEAGLPPAARDIVAMTLASISTRLDLLPAQRRAVDARQAQIDQNGTFYNDLVHDLLSLNAGVTAGSDNASLVNGATTLVGISRATEEAVQQRGSIAQVIILGQPDSVALRQIEGSAGAEDAWLQQFRTTATAAEQAFYNVTVDRTSSAATAMRDDTVNAVQNGQSPTITQQAWLDTADRKIAAMRQVERRITTDLSSTSQHIASSATRDALFGSIGTALVLVVSVVISLLIVSPMTRHLRRLRRGALEVANERLPGVVERLHRGEQVEMSAEEFPVEVQSTDEIGRLAEAFSVLHAVAVRTAIEQAAMRTSVGNTFLNLARRSQALINRQLKVIDTLERKETDPDQLEELFRLDHLATRMRRHTEDLIVLSGSKPERSWRRPIAVEDVMRGAVAEVEDYARVKVMPTGDGAISGHAVGDVIHLLAELIENATSFSPPHTPVQVVGREAPDGLVIEVEDHGLGMSPEELHSCNLRLADPRPFGLSSSGRLGLFVVGRLAERHAISVELRPSPAGGTSAIVQVPAALLRRPGDDGDTADDTAAGVPEQSDEAPRGQSDEAFVEVPPSFATARSDWFAAERPRQGPPPDAAERGAPALPGQPTARRELPAGLPQRGGQAPEEHTEVGLPRRIRRASLAPQLRRDGPDEWPGPLVTQRSPEEVRSMMSSLRSNFGHGLADGRVSHDGDDAGEVT
ncbi:sensor histidine kinase [Frankia tisae]|uniref:sensor histidine kinase n=1 Tax=Frankia tisae TaxID=2950104 RepID=UPI0021BE90A5|nr:nitrate- and nitrite sensing domain-containing protein [Frankia tisae]